MLASDRIQHYGRCLGRDPRRRGLFRMGAPICGAAPTGDETMSRALMVPRVVRSTGIEWYPCPRCLELLQADPTI